jgi:3-isopropylmalate/(R)-2-methylmalate dehydratase large subunit
MAIVETILAEHTGTKHVQPGDMLITDVDRVYVQDGNSPTIAKIFGENEWDRVFDPKRVDIFFDHSVLAPDVRIADRLREAEAFADALGVNVHRAGEGISHVVALECGIYEPGTIVVGADSHTCTGGVSQALALGMGASDVAVAMRTGSVWMRVPETRWVRVRGKPGERTRAKDVLLRLLGIVKRTEFLSTSLEWCGEWVEGLTLDEACTVANMAVELGATCTFLPSTEGREPNRYSPKPPNGSHPAVYELDVSEMGPQVARPHSPADVMGVDECAGQPIDYVFIGSCANSRLSDIRDAATVLKGKSVSRKVHCVVTPGSRDIFVRALREGLVDVLVQSGAIVTPPGCGACVGTQGSIPASGAHVFSTMNRNFQGRMGNPSASIWLGSAVTAAHTAVFGRIPFEREMA